MQPPPSDSEQASHDENQPLPPTETSLAADLRALGLEPGMTVLMHSSLRAVAPWVVGGATAVILALEAVLTVQGALVMPCHSAELSDPTDWQHPPVPSHWWPLILQEMPAYQPDLTPTRSMGVIPENFRKQDGVLRSDHPQTSFAAWGEAARFITAEHALNASLGEQSPLGRIYDLDGWVLLLGVGHDANTSLHLAEYRANFPGKALCRYGAPMLVDGVRQWVNFEDLSFDNTEDFPTIGAAFAQETGLVRSGRVGNAAAQLLPQRPLVDFAVQWMEKNRC